MSDNAVPTDPDEGPSLWADRPGTGKVKQLHTGNLHLFALDEAGIWRRTRSSVRLEPSLWEMLFEIARREALDINELARRVQIRLDPRLSGFAQRAEDPTDRPADGPDEPTSSSGGVRPVNLSSGLRAFVACYFWRLSLRLETGEEAREAREVRLADALRFVSPEYHDTASGRVRRQRAAQVRRGRPLRVVPAPSD